MARCFGSTFNVVLLTILLFLVRGTNSGHVGSKRTRAVWYRLMAKAVRENSIPAVDNLSTCLRTACTKSGNQNCAKPPFISIPGYNVNWNVRLNESQRLEDCKKRLAFHKFRLEEAKRHIKDRTCLHLFKQAINNSTKRIMEWIDKFQRNHTLATAISMTRPVSLKSTVIKTKADWYKVNMQLVANLKSDLVRMKNAFHQAAKKATHSN